MIKENEKQFQGKYKQIKDNLIGEDIDKFMQMAFRINVAKLEELLLKTNRFFKLMFNYISANLMNDNLYAFSYNQTLISMNTSELMNVKGLRIKYIQVDSMNKCIP